MITRRHLLKQLLGIALLSTGVGVGIRYGYSDDATAYEQIVLHYLGEDRLTADAAKSFAVDYSTSSGKPDWKVSAAVASGVYFLTIFRSLLPKRFAEKLKRYDRRVLAAFLLSSSFDPTMKTSEKIEYVGFDPERACNPFARQI